MRFLGLLVILFFVTPSQGQIWIEDFDGSNGSAPLNTSTQCGGDPGDYHFGVVCEFGGGCAIEMNAAWTGLYTNVMGSFLGALDTDNASGCGGPGFDDEFAEWTGIDISSCTDPNALYLCFDIAHFGNDFAPFGGWDSPSNVNFEVTIDGTNYNLVAVEDQGMDTNPAFDLDCDGTGDAGEEISNEFTTYCFALPGLGTSLDIRINIDGLNEDWEDIGIDNIAVFCEPDETSLTGTFLSPCGDCSVDNDCDGVIVSDDCDDNDATVSTYMTATFDAIPNQCEGESNPLPVTSLEGFTGTWSPAFDPNNTTIYTFTPDAGQCAFDGTATVTIDAEVAATFAAIANQCEGESDPLPATSLEGFTGTWSPAFDPNNTTFYTFTPTAGQCASDGNTTVTIDAVTTSTFAAIPNQCEGESDPLPVTSLEGFTGTWTPAFDPNNTTIYTFTPTAGQCASNGTTTVVIDAPTLPDFTDPVTYCELDDQLYSLQTTSPNGVSGTWLPSTSYVPSVLPLGVSVFTFTPDPLICAEEVSINVTVASGILPTFTQLGPYCIDDVPDVLDVVSINGINGTWDGPITTVTPGTTTYTFMPNIGLCANVVTMDILVEDCGCSNPATIVIDPITSICENETLPLNAIIGGSANTIIWSTSGDGSFDNINSLSPIYTPSANDIITGIITLTATTDDPDGGGPCSAVTDQVILTINTLVSPLFTQLGPYCQGDIPDILLTTSLNGITGTWDGPIVTSGPSSTVYNFTPNPDQCANGTTMSVVIDAPVLASFDAIPNQCEGGLDPLPTISLEGFTGDWTPIFDPNNTTAYTFIVDAGQCAIDGDLTLTIDPAIVPTFTQLGPYCVDDIPDVLPFSSLNGVTGSWDGPITTSGPGSNIYTFTPNVSECAITTTMQIAVNDCACMDPAQISINTTLPICENETITLVAMLSGSASSVTWSTNGDGTFDNIISSTPTYTPGVNDIATGSVNVTAITDDPDDMGPCSEASANEIITINTQISPQFTQLGPYCIDDIPDVFPLSSLTGINGTWDGPILTSNSGSSIYTFTPSSGECATNVTMEIIINDCGCSDPAQVTIDAISPICENETIPLTANLGGSASTVTWSTDGDGSFDNVTSNTPTYTPGVNDIASGSASLNATTDDPDGLGPCTETSANVQLTINAEELPQFTQLGPYCIDDTPDVLPLTSQNGISGTWDGPILTSNSGSSIYTYTPNSGECATNVTMEIIINDCGCSDPAQITIDAILPICENETIPLTANLGGSASTVTWSTNGDGAFDNLTSNTPTYSPGVNDIASGSASITATTDDPDGLGPCTETSANVPLTINAEELPQFTQLGPYCIDDTPDVLPFASQNGISGTWDGPILTSNSGSSIYTFTPSTTECASNGTMEIMINDCDCSDPAQITIDAILPICENKTMPLTANLGGSASTVTWSTDGDGSFDNVTSNTPTYTPGVNDIASGLASLSATTDDPDGLGPCTEASANVPLTINAEELPQFTQLGPYCIDDTPDVLPLTSQNGISGTWDEPILTSNSGSSAYTFTPDSDQCASVFITTIVVESCDCNDQITITQSCDDDDNCTINDEETIIESNGAICIPCIGKMIDCTTGEIELTPCDDENQCTTNDVVGIQPCTGEICVPCAGEEANQSQIYYANIFSPNSDGNNDGFTLYTSIDNATITSLNIYDRYGNKVFSKENFVPNSIDLGWDGTMNNKNVVQGVYVFVAVVAFENCNVFNIVDEVTIIR